MFNSISTKLIRQVVLASFVFAGVNAAWAQAPTQTPRPTPVPNDPSRPPGQPVIPGVTTPATNPSAPPGTQQTSPTAPPSTIPQTPAATPMPTPPAGNVPGGSTQPTSTEPSSTEPLREPNIPQFQANPLPPVPSLSRLGVGSEAVPLSLNDAIKRALENNNDIEVERDDVRFAETQLRALEGIF